VDWIQLGQAEHSNQLSGSIKGRVFLDQLSDTQFLKMDSPPWSSLDFYITHN
jgi:hypothetical protein